MYAFVIIGSHVCVEVPKDTKGAFYHCGAWYVLEKDFHRLFPEFLL